MALEIDVGALFDAVGVEAVAQGEGDFGRVVDPQHPGALLFAERYALIGRFTGEDEAVVGCCGGEGEGAGGGVTVSTHRHGAAL